MVLLIVMEARTEKTVANLQALAAQANRLGRPDLAVKYLDLANKALQYGQMMKDGIADEVVQ